MLTAKEIYNLLDTAGIDFEVIEIFEGARFLRIEVDDAKLEDTHRQFKIGDKDFDLVLRTNDEGTEYVAFDIFDYDKQETVCTVKI